MCNISMGVESNLPVCIECILQSSYDSTTLRDMKEALRLFRDMEKTRRGATR
jgi:hypothetical protein